MSWVEIFGPCGVGKTTLCERIADVEVAPCELGDVMPLAEKVYEELRNPDCPPGPIGKWLRMLAGTLARLPSDASVIENGPLQLVLSVMARDGGANIAGRLLRAFPRFRAIHLTADPEVIQERLHRRGPAGGTAQRHLDNAAWYVELCKGLVECSPVDSLTIDTTSITPSAVEKRARAWLKEGR